MRRLGWVVGLVLVLVACGSKSGGSAAKVGPGSSSTTGAPAGVEKAKPAPGTGNAQGKVVFDEKPAVGIAVTLCEKFSQYVGGCSGQQYKAQTDSDGVYVIVNVPPGVYQALTVAVFDTSNYLFAQSGILTPKTYNITAEKTLFVDTTYLWKSDLQLVKPDAGSQVSGTNLTLRWNAYPDATYYMVSVYASDPGTSSPLPRQRVAGTTFTLTTSLAAATYRWQVEAYDAQDHKLAASPDNVTFAVVAG
ncbi:MAG: hypothetical protein QOG97_200 [Acidimicrobiaceae bacterium]|jgi:hypothetical protein|nr:hypothetical protein [Acidimicrobiaceae bacterium]